VSVWERRGEDGEAALHIEELDFDQIEPVQRSYK
jgi:hypothetical protein